MKISKPKWYLSKKYGYCPLCDDQSRLLFISCEQCNVLLLECDGFHTFSARLPLEKNDFELTCSECGTATKNADTATAQQILKAGFIKDDYE